MATVSANAGSRFVDPILSGGSEAFFEIEQPVNSTSPNV